MPTPADLRRQFIKAFEALARHRDKHDVLVDFLEMAVCAIRKRAAPPGPAADAFEEKYMAVVRRNKVEDVRAMPELLAITTLAVQEGGCDFLGQVVGDLSMVTGHIVTNSADSRHRARPADRALGVAPNRALRSEGAGFGPAGDDPSRGDKTQPDESATAGA